MGAIVTLEEGAKGVINQHSRNLIDTQGANFQPYGSGAVSSCALYGFSAIITTGGDYHPYHTSSS